MDFNFIYSIFVSIFSVALEAPKAHKVINEQMSEYEVHPTQINASKERRLNKGIAFVVLLVNPLKT